MRTLRIKIADLFEFDNASPEEKYELQSMPGRTFSGLHLMCLMYAGFKRVAPEHDVQMDLDNPFLTALQLHKTARPSDEA